MYIAISLLLAISSIIFGGQTISSLGLRCAFVGVEQHNEAVRQAVMSGEYQLVYMSPESLLGVLQWRKMFRSPVYQEGLVAIAVDEAHLVEKWYDFMTCNSLIQKTMQLLASYIKVGKLYSLLKLRHIFVLYHQRNVSPLWFSYCSNAMIL